MVEVFKTNVRTKKVSRKILTAVHENFPFYICNFDLEDCDKILRVQSLNGSVKPDNIIDLVRQSGYSAEVLPEE